MSFQVPEGDISIWTVARPNLMSHDNSINLELRIVQNIN
jgi:hypothetical protein